MKPYKTSEVLGKLKAEVKRLERMAGSGVPAYVKVHLNIARDNLEKAIALWEDESKVGGER